MTYTGQFEWSDEMLATMRELLAEIQPKTDMLQAVIGGNVKMSPQTVFQILALLLEDSGMAGELEGLDFRTMTSAELTALTEKWVRKALDRPAPTPESIAKAKARQAKVLVLCYGLGQSLIRSMPSDISIPISEIVATLFRVSNAFGALDPDVLKQVQGGWPPVPPKD